MSEEQDDLLVETRKLLNALNHENSELKERNRELVEKVREAEEAARDARRSEKDLERDSKQLNFNLMQQVHAKSEEARVATLKLHETTAAAREAKQLAEGTQEALDNLAARHTVAQEQLRMMETKLNEERSRAKQLEQESSEMRTHLETTMASERDRAAHDHKASHSTVAQLRDQLAAADRKAADLESRVAELEGERATQAHQHAAEVTRLKVAAQRTLEAESETAYAHDQMLSTADHIGHVLDAQRGALQTAMRGVRESDAAVAAAMQRITEQRAVLAQLREMDETLSTVLQRTVEEMQETTSQSRGEAASQHDAAMAARLDVKRLSARAEDAERAIKRLEEDVAESRRERNSMEQHLADERAAHRAAKDEVTQLDAALGAARLEAKDLREGLSHAKARIADLEQLAARERSELMERVRATEMQWRDAQAEAERRGDKAQKELVILASENEQLRRSLNSHTASLAAELQRLHGVATAAPREESLAAPSATHGLPPSSFRSSYRDPAPSPRIASGSLGGRPSGSRSRERSDAQRAIELSPESSVASPTRAPPKVPSSRASSEASSGSRSPAVAASLAQRILSSVRAPLSEP